MAKDMKNPILKNRLTNDLFELVFDFMMESRDES